jgi:hypothetical protein
MTSTAFSSDARVEIPITSHPQHGKPECHFVLKLAAATAFILTTVLTETAEVHAFPPPSESASSVDLVAQEVMSSSESLVYISTLLKGNSPNAEVASVDFGVVDEGLTLLHRIKIHNDLEFPVEIVGRNASCGCLAFTKSSAHIAPSATENLEISLDTLGIGGTIHLVLRLEVIERGSGQRTTVLVPTIVVVVSKQTVTPRFLHLVGYIGDTLTAEVQVAQSGDGAAADYGVHASSTDIRLERRASKAGQSDDRHFLVSVSLGPLESVGRRWEELIVGDAGLNTPKLSVPIRIDTNSRLLARPSSFYFGKPTVQQSAAGYVTKVVLLSRRDGGELSVTSAYCEVVGSRVDFWQSNERAVSLALSLPIERIREIPAIKGGVVVAQTNDELERETRIRIYTVVTKD